MKREELDLLLAEFREKQPGELRLQKWKNAVHAELAKKPARAERRWMQLVAASAVGFIIGAIFFGAGHPQNIAKENSSGDATYEYVLTKSE